MHVGGFMRKAPFRLLASGIIVLYVAYAVSAILGLNAACNILSPIVSCLALTMILILARVQQPLSAITVTLAFFPLSWAIADTVFAFLLQDGPVVPGKNLALSILFGLPNLTLALAAILIVFRDRKRWSSLQFLADTIAVFSGTLGALYLVFLNREFRALVALDSVRVTAFGYLVLDLIAIAFTISLILSIRGKRTPPIVHLFTIVVFLYAAADTVYIYTSLRGTYAKNGLADVVFLASVALCGIGALFAVEPPISQPVPGARRESSKENGHGTDPRAIALLAAPLVLAFVPGVGVNDLLFFGAIAILHQLASLAIRVMGEKERKILAQTKQKEILESMVFERLREMKIMNQTLENMSQEDATTGLFNRKYFIERVDEWIARAGPSERVWMLILDFDHFKSVNDTYGHDIGDQVLRLAGRRLESVAGDRTVLARLGGDEFGIVCLRGRDEPIESLIRTVSDLSSAPLSVGLFTVHSSMSVGVASYPDDSMSRTDLMRHADIAMYRAKGERGRGAVFFDAETAASLERRNRVELSLRTADFDREFSLVFQGQFSVADRRIVGIEALARWDSPELGTIPPDEFIPIAEETGLIIPLGDWITRRALERIRDWNERYRLGLVMGINVSPIQIEDAGFMSKLEGAMSDLRVKSEWVELEITERCAMKGDDYVAETFRRLAELHVSISIDDFGTGYSSLSYLKKLDVDRLKIAKQLIDGIAVNDADAQIVKAIVMMAKAMRIDAIAEGVEDELQFKLLELLGCDVIQGFYLGRPYPAREFEDRFLK